MVHFVVSGAMHSTSELYQLENIHATCWPPGIRLPAKHRPRNWPGAKVHKIGLKYLKGACVWRRFGLDT